MLVLLVVYSHPAISTLRKFLDYLLSRSEVNKFSSQLVNYRCLAMHPCKVSFECRLLKH